MFSKNVKIRYWKEWCCCHFGIFPRLRKVNCTMQSKFWCSDHSMCIEVRRRDNLPVEDRTCLMGNESVIEDELQFLTTCPEYHNIWTEPYEKTNKMQAHRWYHIFQYPSWLYTPFLKLSTKTTHVRQKPNVKLAQVYICKIVSFICSTLYSMVYLALLLDLF